MWSSIFLFGTIRPTNRKFRSAVAEHRLERRPTRRLRDALDVDGDGEDAGLAKPSASSSGRLYSESPSARSVRPTSVASSWRPSARGGRSRHRTGAKKCGRRDVVVLQHAPVRQARERLGHRRRQREVEDRDVAAPRRRIGERPHVVAQVVVDRQGEEVRLVAHRAQQVAHTAGASPMASPRCAAGTHWLTIIGGELRGRSAVAGPGSSGRAWNAAGRYGAELLELLGLPDLLPEVEGHAAAPGARAAPARRRRSGAAVPPKSLAQQPVERRVLGLRARASAQPGVRRPAHRASAAIWTGSLPSYSTPPPSIVAGTAVAA